jgi:adenylyltransferase/sulfurtransferase
MPTPGKARYHEAALSEVAAHAEAAYPEECCGALLGSSPEEIALAVRLTNIAAASRPTDSSGRERNARDAYEIDAAELDALHDQAHARGLRVVGIYHSHIEVGAYFSQMDRDVALAFGEPTYPVYLVASARAGHCDGLKSFTWDGSEFQEESLPAPSR